MGLSSSKARHTYGELPKLRDIRREDTPPPVVPYYPYPPPQIDPRRTRPPQTNPGPYTPQPGTEPQFGYFIRQRGDDPDDVEMIPGYYYPISEPPSKTRQRRKRRAQSAPTVSSSFSPDREGSRASRRSTTPHPTSPPPPPPPPLTSQPSEAPVSAPVDAQPADPAPDSAEQPPASESPQEGDMTGVGAGTMSRRVKNPLPNPPIDVLETEKYRSLRRTMTDSTSTAPPKTSGSGEKSHTNPTESPRKSSSSTQPRSPQSAENVAASTRAPPSDSPNGRLRAFNLPVLRTRKLKKNQVATARRSTEPDYTGYPHPVASTKYSSQSMPLPKYTPSPLDFPVDTGPPFTFYLHSNLNPASPQPIVYRDKVYPTGAHLFEAFKFLKHKPELAERIRVCSTDANEMSMLSWQFQMSGHVRDDWEHIWRKKLDEVLYLRFTQHEHLRAELVGTGYAQLVDGNEPRPEGVVDAPGVNELGKGLMRLRERLRREEERGVRR